MNNRIHTEQEDAFTEDILNSLNGMKRAEAPAFLYTRIEGRLHNAKTVLPAWVSRPAFSFAILALLLIVNVVAFTRYQQTQSASAVSGIQGFAEEYSLTGSSVFTTVKPGTHE
jgi:hypothetical protein